MLNIDRKIPNKEVAQKNHLFLLQEQEYILRVPIIKGQTSPL
jgi:hypothetical protein